MEQIEPIRHSLMIEADQERTFHAFARRLGTWWPMQDRVLESPRGRELRVEEYAGGRIYEGDGQTAEHEFGRVVAWEPPHSFAFTWRSGSDAESTRVELRFQRLGPALTRVVVAQRGWETLSTALLESYTDDAGGWL
ncbi:SRPBCC domain-containing protein, partial [Actinomadura adrarensis]